MTVRFLVCAVMVSALVSSQLLAQSTPKMQQHKAAPKRPATAPLPPPESKPSLAPAPATKNELSKEFAVLGRRALAALGRLDEHFLDTKTLGFKGNNLELSDAKDSWTLREVAAEKTVFELEAAAVRPSEKQAAKSIGKALSGLQTSHNLIDTAVERALLLANAKYNEYILMGLNPAFLTETFQPVYRAREKATDEAVTAKDKMLSEPCYVSLKEAFETGMMKDECMPSATRDEAAN